MDRFYPVVCVIAAALGVPMIVYWIRHEKTGPMRIGLALVFAVTGGALWAVSEDFFTQILSAGMAATGVGCIIYFAVRGAKPPT